MTIEVEKKQYIEPLTWLRGIAALMVIFSHSLRSSNVSYGPNDSAADVALFRALDLGDVGVTLFFVLSGLTLYLSNASLASPRDALAFYIKRFFRIWPAFAVALGAYIAFHTLFVAFYSGPSGYWIDQHARPFDVGGVVRYLALIFNLTGPYGLFSGQLWTLPVEFQFYLMFPFALWLAARFGAVSLLALGALLLGVGGKEILPFDHQEVLTMAYAFFGGMFIGFVAEKRDFRVHWAVTLTVAVALLALDSLVQNHQVSLPDLPFVRSDRNLFIFSSLVIVALLFKTDVSATPSFLRVALKRYGDISYSTYLFHQLMIGTSVLLFVNLGITGDAKPWVAFFLTVTVSYFVASLAHRYIERPSIALGRRLAGRVGK